MNSISFMIQFDPHMSPNSFTETKTCITVYYRLHLFDQKYRKKIILWNIIAV